MPIHNRIRIRTGPGLLGHTVTRTGNIGQRRVPCIVRHGLTVLPSRLQQLQLLHRLHHIVLVSMQTGVFFTDHTVAKQHDQCQRSRATRNSDKLWLNAVSPSLAGTDIVCNATR